MSEDAAVVVEVGILGRDRELGAIHALIERAGGGGGALVLRGDAGIGKSALLERAVELARSAELRVLRTTGVRTESHLPFAGLHQLLRPILSGLGSLPGPQRSALAGAFGLVVAADVDPFLAALATLTLLTDVAAEAPILAVVDDAQWLDRASLEALAFVARRLGSDPVVMLLATREADPSPIDGAGLPELFLDPLSDVDAREIVRWRAPGLPSAVCDRIVAEAAGSPLALVELSTSITEEVGPGEAAPDVLPVSDRIERAFAAQANDLPADTRWLLLVAALDDRDDVGELLAAADVAESALSAAIGARLVELEGTSLRFRHPLIRSAIQQKATADELHRAHTALAAVVGDDDRAAWHRAAATDGPDETVAELLDAAADRAVRRGAFVAAVSALQRAAALSPDGRSRGTRLLRAADVANELGRMDVIGQLLVQAEPIDVPALEDRRQAWITALSLTGPRSASEKTNLRAVVEGAKRAGADGEVDVAMALLQFASARSWWSDPGYEIRSEIAAAARQLAPLPDGPRAVFIMSIAPEDHIDRVLESLAARAASTEPLTGNDARRYGTAALWMGALDLSVDFLGASISALRDEGRLGLLARSLIVHAFSAAHLGQNSTVASDVDEGFRLGLETRQPFYVATAHVAHAIFLARRGDVEGAEHEIGEVERVVLNAPADAVLSETRHARGLIDLAAGRHDDAWAELRLLIDPGHPSYHATASGWALADLADAAAVTGHIAEAHQILARFEVDRVRMKMPWWRIGAAYARAVLLANGEDPAAAEPAFTAARAMDLSRWPMARARLGLAYGTWLRKRRRAAEARSELRFARDQLDAMGIRHLADRARRELQAAGEVSQHRRVDALDELTPQELQIARLAAEGLSNREIGARLYLSHRTVGSHLYRVFPKLGVSSRSQLHQVLR